MKDFFIENGNEIIYSGVVIASVLLLFFLTKLVYKKMVKAQLKRYPGQKTKTLNVVKWILYMLWALLGLIALGFVFVSNEKYGFLKENFKIVLYLGILTFSTIVVAVATNLWFKKKIDKKILHQEDPTNHKFLRYVAIFLVYFTGVILGLLAFPSLKGIAQTALGGAGVFALIIGVASQEALSNVIGGLFIITFKPFKIDDLVKVTDSMVGVVKDITLRHTVIRNFDNKMIVIPNSIINKERLVNYDLGEKKCCERLEIEISLDSDFMLAQKIMREECENHPLLYDNRSKIDIDNGKPLVKTGLTQINDYSLTIRAWAWCKNFDDCYELRIDTYANVKKRFDKEGVEIPTPYRTIIMKDPKTKGEHPTA